MFIHFNVQIACNFFLYFIIYYIYYIFNTILRLKFKKQYSDVILESVDVALYFIFNGINFLMIHIVIILW